MADAVDELLDREQCDQDAAQGDDDVERGDRRSRGKPERAEAAQEIDIAEPDQTKRDAEHYDADDDLHDQSWRAVHRFRDRGEIEMIVAPGRGRSTNEDGIDELCGSNFLQPQPGMADGPRHDVGGDRQREAEAEDAAQYHQDQLEPIERPPLQMTLPLQYQSVGDGHQLPRRPGQVSAANAIRDP
jgi:hypothetical protein